MMREPDEIRLDRITAAACAALALREEADTSLAFTARVVDTAVKMAYSIGARERPARAAANTPRTTLICSHCHLPDDRCTCPASTRRARPLIQPRDPEPGIRRHAAEIRMEILRRILDPQQWQDLIELAVDRAKSEGARVYGDASYHLSNGELHHEGACEIADLIFYISAELVKGDA